jgi:hypothetical protein
MITIFLMGKTNKMHLTYYNIKSGILQTAYRENVSKIKALFPIKIGKKEVKGVGAVEKPF